MMMPLRSHLLALLSLGGSLLGGSALAHVSVVSPAFAGTTQEITFNIAHGCAGADTLSLQIEIPAEVTAVRTVSSTLGPAVVSYNEAELVSAVTWTKPEAELLSADTSYYKVVLRLKIPNTPLTQLHFLAHQVCKVPGGETTTVDWVSLEPNTGEGGAEPAPALTIMPPRVPGWNKVTVPVALATADLTTYFGDAAIVWKGTAAFSANPNTSAQIAATSGVTALTALGVGDEIWVKY